MKKKKEKSSKALIIVAGLFLIGGSIFAINTNNKEKDIVDEQYYEIEDNKYINNSEELNSDKTFEGIKLEDINFVYDMTRNETNISFSATNKSNKAFKEESILLSFVNKKGEILNTMFAFLPDLEKDQSETIYATISGNVVDAYDMIIEAWNY